MNINQDVFPSKYVKAADIKGRGDVAVVIADAQIEKLGDDRKLVIYFQNKEKGLVCNKTNANRIAYLYGEETDGWVGKEIALGVEFVEFQGKTVEAIRVKPPVSQPAARQHVVKDRGGYSTSEIRPSMKDGLEEAVGRVPDKMDQEIPF